MDLPAQFASPALNAFISFPSPSAFDRSGLTRTLTSARREISEESSDERVQKLRWCVALFFVLDKMGSTSWHDNILQALLIGLVVQIVVSILCVFWAMLWASWRDRMARPAAGESMDESDAEMGTGNVGEGATIPDNPPHGLAANSGVGDDGKLEFTEDMADTRANAPEIPAVDHLPKADCKNVTEDAKRRASVPVVVDVSQPQQVEVLAGKEV